MRIRRQTGIANREHVAGQTDARVREQLPGDGARGHARRRLARARSLEDVAHVRAAVLRHSGEIRMARAVACVTGARRAPPASGGGSSVTRIVYCQFAQSRFSIIIAIGLPMV